MGASAEPEGAPSRPRIALMRAAADSERTQARLRKLGYGSVVAPATEIIATSAAPPHGDHDAVVASSAKAFDLLAADLREAIVGLPLFVVGAQTARAAAERGLELADSPAKDAAALTERLRGRLAPASRVLYLAGRDRKRDLERSLTSAGHVVTAIENYAAEARAAWNAEEARAVADCDAALHYSARGAELALRLAENAGIGDRFRALLHVCISDDAASPLRASGAIRVCGASMPDEDSLLAELERALRTPQKERGSAAALAARWDASATRGEAAVDGLDSAGEDGCSSC